MLPRNFRCFEVNKDKDGNVIASLTQKSCDDLPAGDLTVKVAFSSLNFKDALAVQAHPGVARTLPQVPGVDGVGSIFESNSDNLPVGTQVILGGEEMGAGAWGCWSEIVKVFDRSVVKLPDTLSPLEAATLGTAGFTAGQSILALQNHDIVPASGEIAVSGATGGVGNLAIRILKKLKYETVAITGKLSHANWLKQIGASEVIDRSDFLSGPKKAMLRSRFAGAIDTTGGAILEMIIRQAQSKACITCCGMVAGTDFTSSIYPFILRGVTLCGIDSAWCPKPKREEVWNKLAGDWRIDGLSEMAKTVPLDQIASQVDAMSKGETTGRIVIPLS